MFDILNSIKSLLKPSDVCIDNIIFRMHYKMTVIVLIACSLFVSSNQYIGDPINCIIGEVPSKVMDSYCWIHSTYTIPKKISGIIGREIIHPGVMSHIDGKDEIKFHKYYQWVCIVLFFQATLFYIPGYLWLSWEGKRISALTLNLNSSIVNMEYAGDKMKIISKYFEDNFWRHNSYAWRFFICEILNFSNVFAQIYFMNFFLDNEFFYYGINVFKAMKQQPEIRDDPMSRIFPKVTKCSFHKYGPSGTLQKLDGLCVLSLNIINEKIYVLLWLWFFILGILSCLAIVYRIFTLLIPKLRCSVFYCRTRTSLHKNLRYVLEKCEIGDWFILYQLSKNINALVFEEIVLELSIILKNKSYV